MAGRPAKKRMRGLRRIFRNAGLIARGADSAATVPAYLAYKLSKLWTPGGTDYPRRANLAYRRRRYRRADGYDFGGIWLPPVEPADEDFLLHTVVEETFFAHLFFRDRYPPALHARYEKALYGYEEPDGFRVAVAPGDIVCDVGGWIGDFAAYAAHKGAGKVYAFEPVPATLAVLRRTAERYPAVVPVGLGLGDKEEARPYYHDEAGGSFADGFMPIDRGAATGHAPSDDAVPVMRLDDWVARRAVDRVDFLKADIEGFERHMLAGARATLARFAPKLAVCTYHLPDDPEVLEGLSEGDTVLVPNTSATQTGNMMMPGGMMGGGMMMGGGGPPAGGGGPPAGGGGPPGGGG